jgi:hypothetical protein
VAMPAAGAQPSLQPPGRPTPQTPCPAPLSACLPACLSVCPQSKKSLEFWQGQDQAGTPCIDVTEVVAAVSLDVLAAAGHSIDAADPLRFGGLANGRALLVPSGPSFLMLVLLCMHPCADQVTSLPACQSHCLPARPLHCLLHMLAAAHVLPRAVDS